jgi:hypothetical protein
LATPLAFQFCRGVIIDVCGGIRVLDPSAYERLHGDALQPDLQGVHDFGWA